MKFKRIGIHKFDTLNHPNKNYWLFSDMVLTLLHYKNVLLTMNPYAIY